MRVNDVRLPRSIQEIADVIGRERALFLVSQLPRCFPASRKSASVVMYVPKRMSVKHELVRILGWNDANALCQHFGGEILYPACCTEIYRPFRDAGIRSMAAQGCTIEQLAEWFDLTTRHIKNVISGGAVEITQEVREAANDDIAAIDSRKAG